MREGEAGTQLPTFDAESKSAKIPCTVCVCWGWRGGGGGAGTQLPTFDAEIKSAKIPISLCGGVGVEDPSSNFWCWVQIGQNHKFPITVRGGARPNFQLLMPSPKSAKSQIPYMVVVGEGGGGSLIQLPTFDAESKNFIVEVFAENFLSFCHDFITFRVPKVNKKWSR